METKNDINLNWLDQIQKVDASPFLLTRIEQRIANKRSNKLSKPLTWSLGFSFIVLLVINTIIITQVRSTPSEDANLVVALKLMPDNNLYK